MREGQTCLDIEDAINHEADIVPCDGRLVWDGNSNLLQAVHIGDVVHLQSKKGFGSTYTRQGL